METDGLTIAVAGMTGTGKTSWVREHLSGEPRLLVVDVRAEHTWLPLWEPEEQEGYEIYTFLRWLKKHEASELFAVRVIPPGDDEEAQLWVEMIGRMAYILGNVTVVLEEADLFSKPQGENRGVKVMHNYGRNRGVTFVYLVRVVNSVNRLLTTNTKAWILFRLEEPHYLEGLDARFDFDVVGEVSRLQDLEYIEVRPDRTWAKDRVNL